VNQNSVTIANALIPSSITIAPGDTVVWVNQTAGVQTASSNDGGQTFTTGPIQPGASSLPITVPGSTGYRVSPAGFPGTITVNRNDI
jgi:plastocyanin